MLDRPQIEFLLADDNIDKIRRFLEEMGYKNIRICPASSEEQEGKIVLLLSNPTDRDDYTNCKDIHALKKAVHYKKLDFMIEERLRKDSISRIVDPSVPLTKAAVQQLAKEKDETFGIDLNEDDSNEEVLVITMRISVKRTRIDDKAQLVQAVKHGAEAAIEPHLVKNGLKRPSSQA